MTSSTIAMASPAVLKSPRGVERPGVALIDDRGPRLVITAEAAFRIAGEIADVIENLRNETTTEKETA